MHSTQHPSMERFGLVFSGGVSVRELQASRCKELPRTQGVYLIVRNSTAAPDFLETSVGGWFKGKNPTMDLDTLRGKWVADSPIVYIGKAGGDGSSATLNSRLWQYMQFGLGKDIGHWGGRYIWQLADNQDLAVWWVATDRDAETVESELLAEFLGIHKRLPFANLKVGRSPFNAHQQPQSKTHQKPQIRLKMDSKVDSINAFIQSELTKRGLTSVVAVEAAIWLDKAGLLKDSESRPGKPLRDLLRAGAINRAVQDSSRRWVLKNKQTQFYTD